MSQRKATTARGAIGSLFATVSAIGTATTSLFDTANDGVGMLNRYVGDAAEKQRIASDYELATFEEKLLDEVTLDEAKRTREIKVFFAEDAENRGAFETAHARIKAAVLARRNPSNNQAHSPA
jgi:hypothetical protein